MQMIALFPGSFDPLTKGHLQLIHRAARLSQKLYVAVLNNPDKHSYFPIEDRLLMLRQGCSSLQEVEVVSFTGLLVDLAASLKADVIIRGVRGASDLEQEILLSRANAALYPGLETVFLPASSESAAISSSLVRQILSLGGDISPFVPESVLRFISGRSTQPKTHKP